MIFISILAGLLATVFTFWQEATQLRTWQSTARVEIMIVTAFLFVSLSAIVFPYVMKDTYRNITSRQAQRRRISIDEPGGNRIYNSHDHVGFLLLHHTRTSHSSRSDSATDCRLGDRTVIRNLRHTKLTRSKEGVDFGTIYAEIPLNSQKLIMPKTVCFSAFLSLFFFTCRNYCNRLQVSLT